MTLSVPVASVLMVASHEVGVHEQGGNNHGPRVEEYLASVGLGAGNPWCAAFVAWCLQQAGVRGWPMTGDTWSLEDWARARGCLMAEPQAGDVFLLLGADGRPVHTGLVERVVGDQVATIEGNTGMASDTDGDGVARKARPVASCAFIHWDEHVDTAPSMDTTKWVKIYWHDGIGTMVLDGRSYPLRGVKIGPTEDKLAPWPGGVIKVGY